MANQEKIDQLIGESAFAQIEKLKSQLDQTQKKFIDCVLSAEKLNAVLAKSSGFKELEASAKNSNAEMLKMQKLQDQAVIIEERKKQAIMRTAEIQAKSDRAKAISEQKIIDIENNRIVALNKKRKAIISNSQLEIDAYNNTVNGSKKVNSTINEQNKAYAAASSQAAGYVSATKKITTETLKVKPAAIDAQKSINSLKIQLQSYQNIAANAVDPKTISSFNLKAQETEATIGRLSNVGKKGFDEFGNAIVKSRSGLSGVWQGLKTVANILPGVGIAGLLAFAIEPIAEYISSLDIFKKKANDAKLAQEDIAKALTGTEYADAVTNVNELTINIDLAKRGLIDKEAVLKQYNESIGKTTGQVSTLTQAEDELTKNAPNYIKATLLKAAAQVALENAAKSSYEAELKRRSDTSDFYNKVEVAGLSEGLKSLLGDDDELIKNRNKRAETERNKRVKIDEDAAKKQIDIAKKFQKDAANLSKSSGFVNFLENDDKPKKRKIEKPNTDEFDLQKQRLEILRESYKQISDDEKLSLDERISALQNYDETVRSLIKLEAENAIDQAGLSEKRKLIIKEKANKDLLDADKDFASKSNKIFEDQLTKEQKERLRVNQAELTAITNEEALKLDVLNKAFINGTISEKQHGDLKLDIQREYFVKYINAEIKQVEDLMLLSSNSADQRAEYEKNLAKLKLKASEEASKGIIDDGKKVTKSEEENAKKREEIDKQLSEKKKQLQQEVFDLGVAIVNGSFENEKNKVQKDIDLLDRQKEHDIENVNISVATEEEKANKIAIIEAKALANKEVLEQKQREIEQRKARFQKAIAAAEVAVNTAKDIAKISSGAAALSIIPIVGPALAAAALSQIPFVVGIGAAQIAAILATPIPQYKYGKKKGDNYSGPAIVGDGYEHELRIEKNGEMSLTPNTPTLTTVSAGTQIIGGADFRRLMSKPPTLETGRYDNGYDLKALIAAQENNNKKLIKAFSKQKPAKGPNINFYGLGDYMTRNFN